MCVRQYLQISLWANGSSWNELWIMPGYYGGQWAARFKGILSITKTTFSGTSTAGIGQGPFVLDFMCPHLFSIEFILLDIRRYEL